MDGYLSHLYLPLPLEMQFMDWKWNKRESENISLITMNIYLGPFLKANY